MRTLSRFWNDEHGTIVSAEIILVLTIAGIGMLAGLTTYRDQVTLELADLGTAVSQFNHSYSIGGVNVANASIAQSLFDDLADFCDDTSSDPLDPANAGTSCVAIIDGEFE
jgi:Flp pilus assembly pilin Flp